MASSGPRNALSKTTAAATTAARTTAHAATGTAHAAARALALAPTVALNAALSPSLTGLLLLVLTTRGGPSFVRDARARLERVLSSGIGGSGGGLRTAVEARRRLDRATDVLKVLFAVGLARVLNAVLNRWAMQQWRWKRPAVGLGGGAGRVAAREKNSPVLWDFDGKRGVGEVVVVTGANVVFYGCDLTSSSSIHETAAMVRADCGNPTVLINNAGIAQQHAILEGSDEYDEQLFRVNVLSHFTLIREFLPGMLAQKKGHIFTVASLSSYFTPSGIVNYAASKAAVLSLHEGLNVELRHRYGPAGKHIITSIIHPTWTQTPIMDSWVASLRKTRTLIREPAEVARKIVHQVLRAEPAQVFVPESGALFSSFRGWPTWIQEILRDGADKKTRPLGDYDNSKGKGRASDVGYGVGEDREAFGNSRSYDIVEE
ncbi:Dehydrogenase RED3 [Lasiodiplodia hormozganensis]|uniref:Dehydrogenase RED3 n=1 Tax=Lasiodiplodia hormozganensis TaxID=869390 RepID=A0AA39YEA7_9PEZI|nr:Dehydrogenase RED3 [Lasiodiplodia hormozganensis]